MVRVAADAGVAAHHPEAQAVAAAAQRWQAVAPPHRQVEREQMRMRRRRQLQQVRPRQQMPQAPLP